MKQEAKRGAVPVFVVLTALLFGTMEVALKVAGGGFDAMQLTFLRFLIGGIVLLPFAVYDLRKRQVHLTLGDWGYLLTLGIICISISMTAFQAGIMRSNANLAAIIISINPVFTMVFAHFMTEDKFTLKKALVLLISILGMVIFADPRSVLSGKSDPIGIALVLVASITFGLYTAFGKRRIAKIGGMAQNSLSFLLGSAVSFVLLLAMHRPIIAGIHVSSLPLLLYLGFFVTGLGYYCYTQAIALGSPSTASIAFFIKPIIAVALAAVILHEAVTIHVLVGVVLILLGSALNLSKINLSLASLFKTPSTDSEP